MHGSYKNTQANVMSTSMDNEQGKKFKYSVHQMQRTGLLQTLGYVPRAQTGQS